MSSGCSDIRSASLGMLPADILTRVVLPRLNEMTGSKGILNTADIPVIMRYVTNLSLTCKNMYQIVNSEIFTSVFLEVLKKRYQKSEAYMAVTLDTPGARRWLWNHINTNGYKEIYDTIQDIYALAATISKKAKATGLCFNAADGRKERPSPNPYYYQTQTGFFLNTNPIPRRLATPFGEITLYTDISGRDLLPITEMFIRRLNAKFVDVFYSEHDQPERDNNRLIPISNRRNSAFKKISCKSGIKVTERELETWKGKKILIANRYGGRDSLYSLQGVGKRLLPPASWPLPGQEREYEVVDLVWKMLEKQRLGQDPVGKKRKRDDVSLNAAEPPKRQNFGNLRDFSNHAISLVNQLAQQPIFTGKRWLSVNSRVLPLKSYVTAQAVEILNNAALQFLPVESRWNIHAYGCGNNRIYLNDQDLGDGLDLWLDQDNKPCDLQTLKSAYDTALSNIGLKWEAAKLKDFPKISFIESEEDYLLFVKNQSTFPEEDCFIRVIAEDLGISKFVHCGSHWEDDSYGIYLWIKKDKFDQVSKCLQLSFQ